MLPVVLPLDSLLTPFAALERVAARWTMPLLLESCLQRPGLGRYSFLTADPFETHVVETPEYGVDPFRSLRRSLERYPTEHRGDLPPFQGGAAGLLCYELGRCWEKLPAPARDEQRIPAMVVGIHDWVIAWDHVTGNCWLISQGFPETSDTLRLARARSRGEAVRQLLMSPAPANVPGIESVSTDRSEEDSIPYHSNFGRDGYLRGVEQVIEYIRAGDIFQANLSQRLSCSAGMATLPLYRRLREMNPATFAGYFASDDWAVLSSSPERFMQVQGEVVSTRPIKGTRRRRRIPEADLYARDELRESEKDRAENVMIVDLLRNDLSRVCMPGTMRVPELCSVETYETVTHLVSEVKAKLQPGKTFWDVMAASFPGGSITGAPKVRAMEIIAELEQVARGPYCGSLFYCGFDGWADSSILIRTLTHRFGQLSFPVGGGVVVQSSPQAEYEETLAKAAGMLRALE